MILEICSIIIFIFVVIVLLIRYIVRLKLEIRNMSEQISSFTNEENEKIININFFDKYVEKLSF